MTLQAKIERDLEAGPSTSSALSQRLGVSVPAVETVLNRMMNENLVRARTLEGVLLVVWRLNDARKEVA
jgi:Mn-dependent DtxR family transcriptional regulator